MPAAVRSIGRAPIDMPMTSCTFDFTECQSCGRICTKPEMDHALGLGGSGHACPCGGIKYRPINLPWYGWLLPRVLLFALSRLRGQA